MGLQNKISFKKILLYRFESTLSKGTQAIILWLSIVAMISCLLFGCLLLAFQATPTNGNSKIDFLEAFWQSLLYTINTGAIQNDSAWTYRIIAVFATLVGIFVLSSLIGVLTNGLDKLLTNIRKGKSEVLETDFTLILGWSPSIFKIINELVIGHCDLEKRKIVVLADRDKITMEDELKNKVNQKVILFKKYPDHRAYRRLSKIICRTGNPIDLDDLKIVMPQHAKSIIIIPTEEKNPDAYAIKCILALESLGVQKPIITELKQKSNKNIISHDFKDEKNLVLLPAFDWLSKITAQTSRQSGYSTILSELINYQKSQIYVFDVPEILIDQPFEKALLSIQNCILLGIEKNTGTSNPVSILNPLVKATQGEENRIIRKSDRLIVLMDEIVHLEIDSSKINKEHVMVFESQALFSEKPMEKLLILGWNNKVSTIINELQTYISKDSTIKILSDIDHLDTIVNEISKSALAININITAISGDPTNFETLESLGLKEFDSVLVVGSDNLGIQEKDANTILTLLHLNTLLKESDINIVAEMYDDKNRRIAQTLKTCDFIISENIISSLMAQLSGQKDLFTIFSELFDSSGCSIYLKPIGDYISLNAENSFYDVYEKAALGHNEIALGYRLSNEFNRHDANYGVYLNPLKNKRLSFSEKDMIIVLGLN
jgi:hypothetical protein